MDGAVTLQCGTFFTHIFRHLPYHPSEYPKHTVGWTSQTALRSLVPLGDRVLVKRAPKELQTAAGIYLPSDKTKDPNEGSVVAVGPGERDMTGVLHPTLLKTGDTVLLPEYGGTKIKIDEDELFLFRESDILGKFE